MGFSSYTLAWPDGIQFPQLTHWTPALRHSSPAYPCGTVRSVRPGSRPSQRSSPAVAHPERVPRGCSINFNELSSVLLLHLRVCFYYWNKHGPNLSLYDNCYPNLLCSPLIYPSFFKPGGRIPEIPAEAIPPLCYYIGLQHLSHCSTIICFQHPIPFNNCKLLQCENFIYHYTRCPAQCTQQVLNKCLQLNSTSLKTYSISFMKFLL